MRGATPVSMVALGVRGLVWGYGVCLDSRRGLLSENAMDLATLDQVA